MILFKQITDALAEYPQLYGSVPFLQIDRFVRFSRRLKFEIQLNQTLGADLDSPPLRLPRYVHNFLRDALVITDEETMQCWAALRNIVWHGEFDREEHLADEDVALFEKYGTRVDGHKKEDIGKRAFCRRIGAY